MNNLGARHKAQGARVKENRRDVNPGCFFPKILAPIVLLLLFHVPCAMCLAPAVAFGSWPGVDESVVEKVAGEHGRHAREPLINTDQGDLLLFVFLLAGAAGGFAAGYYWRMLTERPGEKKGKPTCRE